MSFNPSENTIDPELSYKSERILRKSDHGFTILAKKLNEDSQVVIQCIKTDLREDIISEYIERIKSVNTGYIHSGYLKYYPKYTTFLSMTPFFEKSLDTIKPMNFFTGIKSRNKLFSNIIELLRNFESHDLIHGDLKISNIFMSNEGKWIVGDYYKYKLLPQTFPSIYLADRIYCSPEMINNKQLTIKSDIWSFGCIIYYCGSGRNPFCSNTAEEINENINNAKYKPLTDECEVYNNILSKIFVVDEKDRISISELSDYFMNNDNLPVPSEEGKEENGEEEEEDIALPSSESKKIEIYNLENQDIDILTSDDFDRIWTELVYCQWCNDKEGMMKYMNYIKSLKEQGSALDKFMDKLVNNIEYLPFLWDVIEDYVNDYYKRSSSNYRIDLLPISKYPSIFNFKKRESVEIPFTKIIGDQILAIRRQYAFGRPNDDIKRYEEVQKVDDISSIHRKRLSFFDEIKDVDDEIIDPVKLFSLFFEKHLTPERAKFLKVPLQYLPQYVLCSNNINIYPVKSGFYTSISISPNLPKGLELNKNTGRIYGYHKAKRYFNREFTVTAFINEEEISKSTFTLVLDNEKAIVFVEKRSALQPNLYLKYKRNHYSFKVGEEIDQITPAFICENPSFSFINEVAPGLKIDKKTGIISGILTQYFNEYSLIVNMTNGYESTSEELLISCDANGKKDAKEWIIPVETKKVKNIICETNQEISIPIPNVNSIKDRKNLTVEPSLPKDILELNYHNCSINGVSSKPLPKTHYIVKNKENKKVVYEFDLEIKSPFEFSYPKDQYSFKIGDEVNIKPTVTIDDKESDSFTYVVGCDRKLPNDLTLNRFTGLICGVINSYVWEDDYEIRVQSNFGLKTIKLTLFTGEKPKSFKYKESVVHCFEDEYIGCIALFEGRCCEFRIVEGELPSGFEINKWNGSISGRTLSIGIHKMKVRCENMLGYIEAEITIDVSNIYPSAIEYEKNLYEFVINKPINPIIPKINNKGDYYFLVHSNNLPTGLSIDNKTGVISGTPTEICKNEKTGIMRNKEGEEKEYGNKIGRNIIISYKERNTYYSPLSLYIHIGEPPKLFKYGDRNEYIVFRSRYSQIIPTFDDCECIFCVVNGELPNGIVINSSNGSIYGVTHDPIKSYDVTVRCKNSFGSLDVKLKIEIHEYFINKFRYDDKCYYLCQNEVIEPIEPLDLEVDGECDIQKSKLPAGLSINKKGIITGNPTTPSDKCDYLIYFNGVIKSLVTPVKISVGNKPNFELKYENKGICRCGFERKFRFCLLNDQNEIQRAKGFFSIQPDLPVGIRLNQQTGEIKGEGRSENDDYRYKVTFENHFGKISTEVEIISGIAPNPISYPQPYYSFDLNMSISITSLKYEGDDLKFSINPPLPEGLSIRSDCGIISGKTPSKPYYQKHKVIASNDYGSSETDLLLYFGNADYFVYYDDIKHFISKDDEISIKPRICALPDGLKMIENCEIVGITKSTMKLTKYTIIQKNEFEYSTNLLLEIGDKPKPLDYEKSDIEEAANTFFSFIPKEKYEGCRFTVDPPFPEGVQIHVINGKIYGQSNNTLSKTNYTITCSNKYGNAKKNISLTVS